MVIMRFPLVREETPAAALYNHCHHERHAHDAQRAIFPRRACLIPFPRG